MYCREASDIFTRYERQQVFVLPKFNWNGFQIGIPIFLALSDKRDSQEASETLTLIWGYFWKPS